MSDRGESSRPETRTDEYSHNNNENHPNIMEQQMEQIEPTGTNIEHPCGTKIEQETIDNKPECSNSQELFLF